MKFGGNNRQIYYFAKYQKEETGVSEIPEGRFVAENKTNGFPMLKKK